jgi:prepilin-type processing-associated H-X9-DG protein
MDMLDGSTSSQWAVVNHLDIVPILTRPLHLGYSQFGNIAYYDGHGELVYLSGQEFNGSMLQRLIERLGCFCGPAADTQVLDHLMYLGVTSRTAGDTPLDQYVYCRPNGDCRLCWLDDDSQSTSSASAPGPAILVPPCNEVDKTD